MTPEQIALVRKSFSRVQPRINEFSGMFYVRLFDQNPELCLLFGGKADQQARALGATLELIVKLLDLKEKLLPMLQFLGQRHVAANVKPEHFKPFGASLLWTLEQMLKHDFTPEVRNAWEDTYAFLAEHMQ